MESKKDDWRKAGETARRLMEKSPAIDLHVHTLLWAWLFGRNPARRHRLGQTDLPRTAAGLVGAQFQALASLPFFGGGFAKRNVISQIDRLDRLAERYPRAVIKAVSADDVIRARQEGKIAWLLGVEGAHGLGGRPENVEALARRGVRYLGLAHLSRNLASSPSVGWGADAGKGLTGFGRELIAACEESGVIVDLAHLSHRGFWEAVGLARKPLIVSHTGLQSVYRHERNIDDDQVRAVAATGGMVGVAAVAWIVGGGSVHHVARHLERLVELVGPDHAAIGSDLDSPVRMVREVSDVSGMPELVRVLVYWGWPEQHIAGVIRNSVLRLLRKVPPKFGR